MIKVGYFLKKERIYRWIALKKEKQSPLPESYRDTQTGKMKKFYILIQFWVERLLTLYSSTGGSTITQDSGLN